jgi:hypothetical protein
MSYQSMSIRKAMAEIKSRRFLLPAIQRKFVWERDQIEGLFDSILRGYPIGTFLFWKVRDEKRNDYSFYQFIDHYHERDSVNNLQAHYPHESGDNLTGVLDGQQRLTSMFVALQGSYSSRRKYGKAHNDSAYPRQKLYVNLLVPHPGQFIEEADEDGERPSSFRFLTDAELLTQRPDAVWFEVKRLLEYDMASQVLGGVEELRGLHPQHAQTLSSNGHQILTDLWHRLSKEAYINYFEVDAKSLDEVVEIFVRVNSGGTQLSKTDLMFSTIVAHWEEGRDAIEDLISELNGKGKRFAFDSDFVMRCCLVLTDLPVLFRVKSFRKENIRRIVNDWEEIRKAISAAVDLMAKFGYSGDTLTSQTAVVPLAYFAFKGGDVGRSEPALRQFVIRSLLKQVFSSKTDQALALLRDDLGSVLARSSVLTVEDLSRLRLPEQRTLIVSEQDLDKLIDTAKGKSAFTILAALYDHLRFDQVSFHQDHLHPVSGFTKGRLEKLGLRGAEIEAWQDLRDRLPNLQLLEGRENQSKSDSTLVGWIQTLPESQRALFRVYNHIPEGTSLAFEDFQDFFEARKAALRAVLARLLDVEADENPSSPEG